MEEDTRDFSFRVIRTSSQVQIVREVLRADLVLMNGGISVKVCLPALLSGKALCADLPIVRFVCA
jgi:hypothetical protein